MQVQEVLDELKTFGDEKIKRILLRHGVQEPVLGVRVEHLKKLQKRIKRNHALALALYETGIYDAMYLAGLIVDDRKMTKKDLQAWLRDATSQALCSYTVPWVAAESGHGHDLALTWIKSRKPAHAAAGWTTLTCVVSLTDDADLDLDELRALLQQVKTTLHQQPDAVRYAMNQFVMAVGIYVQSLTDEALAVGKSLGKVEVDMGDTACKVPAICEMIEKARARGSIGKKRKTVKC